MLCTLSTAVALLVPSLLAPDSAATEHEASGVDFSYSFAPPHRLALSRPEGSEKTLLDLQPGSLRVAWSYDDLRQYPLESFKTPPTSWGMNLTPTIDDQPFAATRWARFEGCLPGVDESFEDPRGTLRIRGLSGVTAAVFRLDLTNHSDQPARFAIRCDSTAWGENPAWMDPARWVGDNIVAGWNERADRVLILGVGADSYSLTGDGAAPGPKAMVMVWQLPPGESAHGWIVRPYRSYDEDLPALREHDWDAEIERGRQEWLHLLDRCAGVRIPDPGVREAFLACLADLFVMRERVADGYIAGTPGTEGYRAANSGEAAIVAIALDQMGYHAAAEDGFRVSIDFQEPDGNWNDARGWCHRMWAIAGFKSWAAIEHYQLTGDRDYLARVFPRMLASSRWQERERARTRVLVDGAKPLTYGLMPRGMGDCGLLEESGDLYGVFVPHNIWAVYADKVALQVATILGKQREAEELRGIYDAGRTDLLAALGRGAIQEDGYRWIPGVLGKTSGSRWGALNALFPCHLLAPDDPLVEGTLKHIEANMSPGGIPMRTGWLQNGMWVAITLDNIAEAHLVRGEGDPVAKYLYATLNHGTPVYTWCEERAPEAGTTTCTGDRQHLWTPVAVVRCVRDSLVMERGDGLDLALATPRGWLASGRPVGIEGAPTHYGRVSYEMTYDGDGTVEGTASFDPRLGPESATLHIRLPEGRLVASVDADSGASVLPDGTGIRWQTPRGKVRFRVSLR